MGRKKKEVVVVPEIRDYKPNVYFETGNIPKAVDKANVGDKVKFIVEGRVTSKSESDSPYQPGKQKSARVEVDKVKPVNKAIKGKIDMPKTTPMKKEVIKPTATKGAGKRGKK